MKRLLIIIAAGLLVACADMARMAEEGAFEDVFAPPRQTFEYQMAPTQDPQATVPVNPVEERRPSAPSDRATTGNPGGMRINVQRLD